MAKLSAGRKIAPALALAAALGAVQFPAHADPLPAGIDAAAVEWCPVVNVAARAGVSEQAVTTWCNRHRVVCFRLPSSGRAASSDRGNWRVAVWRKSGLPVRTPRPAREKNR